MTETYRFSLEKSEIALNIVLGSALGAYVGVALSLSDNQVNLGNFGGFLFLLYIFVRALLLIQHYARDKYWMPFALFIPITSGMLFLSYLASKKLPLDSGVFASIGGLWLASVILEPLQNLIFERIVPKRNYKVEQND